MIQDSHGRPLDDLDILRMRVSARDLVGDGNGYSITTPSGHPICGYVPDKSRMPQASLVSAKFEKHQA